MNGYEFFTLDVSEGLASITLRRPPLNIMHNPMLAEFNAVLEVALAEANLAAVLIGAEGRAFSAGVDVGDHSTESAAEMIRLFHGIFRRLASTDALTIAAVDGAALGGGCELACFCDLVLASDRARFGQPEVKVGVFPPVAACVLPRLVGLRAAVELTVLGEIIGAAEAHRIGLISRVYPVDAFATAVEAYLEKVRALSRPVVRLAKRATVAAARGQIMDELERAERLYLNELMALADTREGVAAFVDKRAPQWSHA